MNSAKSNARRVREFVRRVRRGVTDTLLLPITAAALLWLRHVRRTYRIETLPRTREACQNIGVYPIIDHYYEPLIDRRHLDVGAPRRLCGIDWRPTAQWQLVEGFEWHQELRELVRGRGGVRNQRLLHGQRLLWCR